MSSELPPHNPRDLAEVVALPIANREDEPPNADGPGGLATPISLDEYLARKDVQPLSVTPGAVVIMLQRGLGQREFQPLTPASVAVPSWAEQQSLAAIPPKRLPLYHLLLNKSSVAAAEQHGYESGMARIARLEYRKFITALKATLTPEIVHTFARDKHISNRSLAAGLLPTLLRQTLDFTSPATLHETIAPGVKIIDTLLSDPFQQIITRTHETTLYYCDSLTLVRQLAFHAALAARGIQIPQDCP